MGDERCSPEERAQAMVAKTRIMDELGEKSLLLPALVNTALAANDRANYTGPT